MKRIINILKSNYTIYNLYSFIMNFVLRFLKIFIKVNDNIILINSFGGKKYDDSPKVIFEYMKTQEKYKKYDIYWAFHNPNDFKIDGANIVKTNSLKYFIIALRAKYWITNSGIERGLKFKNKKTIYINTWHGSAIKKIGEDSNNKSLIFFRTSKPDYMIAQSEFDIEIFSRLFNISKDKIRMVGLPRNDELFDFSQNEVDAIKEKLELPKDKKIILYAPTFREYQKDKNGCYIAPPINILLWKKYLADNYIILFRAHYEICTIMNIEEDDFLFNVSNYPNLNELLKVSDILISDYSSVIIDYSILERPIYSYAYDYEEYCDKRGLYIDIEKELPFGICKNEKDLLERIINDDIKIYTNKIKSFKNKYVQAGGESKKFIDDIIS